jgi:hypothetical protein
MAMSKKSARRWSERLRLEEIYLSPRKDTTVSLAHRIRMLRAIEAGDSGALGGDLILELHRESGMAAQLEAEILAEASRALRRRDGVAFASRLRKAFQMVNAGKVSCNVANNATAMALLAIGQLLDERRRWPSRKEVLELVESYRADGLPGTGKLSRQTWHRVFTRLRTLF